jgi:hypothetical protein
MPPLDECDALLWECDRVAVDSAVTVQESEKVVDFCAETEDE